MRIKNTIVALMTVFALLVSPFANPLAAAATKAKKHQSSCSSSTKTKKDDTCCKKNTKLLKEIRQTTNQDLIVDTTTLQVVNQINNTVTADLAIDQEILADVDQLLNCNCTCTVIEPADFMDSDGLLSVPYVITTPGNYCLGADVAFNPQDLFLPAIVILSSNVNLDLRGFTLSQDPTNGIPAAYGIQIGQGYFYEDPNAVLENVTVKNGSITNFSSVGVFCYNGSFDDPTFDQVPFISLTFTDLNILDCGPIGFESQDFGSGIDLDSAANPVPVVTPETLISYSDVLINNCNISRSIGHAGINVSIGDNVIITNTTSNDLTTQFDTVLQGCFAYSITGRNIQMSNCQGNGTSDFDPLATGAQVGGLNLESSLNIYIKDCQFNDSFGESDDIVNSNLSLNDNMVVENCQFNNSAGGGFATVVSGVHGSSALTETTEGTGVKYSNCQFNGTTVSPDNTNVEIVSGYLSTCISNIVFENCQACNIQSAVVPSAFNVTVGYFIVAFDSDSPGPQFADSSNITFKNCIASDIQGPQDTAGFSVGGSNLDVTGVQIVHRNMVFENCIAERISSTSTSSTVSVAGIAENIIDTTSVIPSLSFMYPLQLNLFVKGCRISDVRSNVGDVPSDFSAGILVQSVNRPVIVENSISDCDRGILLTGLDMLIPNCFQLAASQADALATPPVPVELDVALQVTISPDPNSINPIQAFYTTNGPRLTAPIAANAVVTNPPDACTTVTNNLTGKIGIVERDGACNSATFVLNAEAAGEVATLIIANGADPSNFAGNPSQTKVAVAISQADGAALIASLTNSSIVTIDLSPSIANTYTFTDGLSSVTINSTQVSAGGQNFICPGSIDLMAAGWEAGDPVTYNNNGNPDLPTLTMADNPYYAILYNPGFSTNGLIQSNEIDNCSISCYQDDAPTTSSAWVNNAAFNCGAPPTDLTNYDINFAGVRPVDAGTLSAYPTGSNKYYNLSLVP